MQWKKFDSWLLITCKSGSENFSHAENLSETLQKAISMPATCGQHNGKQMKDVVVTVVVLVVVVRSSFSFRFHHQLSISPITTEFLL